MKDVYILEGATFERTFSDTDTTADTLEITISDTTGIVLSHSESYSVVDNEAVATLSFNVNLPIGKYQYMYTITYTDGYVLKLPEPDGCKEGDCSLPAFIVCDANDVSES